MPTSGHAAGDPAPDCASCPLGAAGHRRRRTLRPDRWWVRPILTGTVLAVAAGYSAWAAWQTTDYTAGPYISPIFSPCLAAVCGRHADVVLLGPWWRLSPALVVVGFPIGLRATCYYYRKVYYRSFWLSPPACAVGQPHRRYSGESRFPLLLQNIHRYLWCAGLLVACVLSLDAVRSFHFATGWRIGLGSLVLTANALFFWGYMLSCHSCRHLVGGGLRTLSGHPVRRRLWTAASALNARHPVFAWLSLPTVVLTDIYVRLLATGVLHDPRLF
ncbi:MAG TPA: hypothetical protein VN796_00055 [Acidimicrobiales bacterium]|nr:hypothetical protein [Acidimicrobiales bacterium]